MITALLMLNLGKEKFISKNNFKRSFQMTLMTVENLVYNKLARQKISCFINAISSLVVLIYCYHYYYYFYHYCYYYYHYYYHCYFYYYYHYYYCFIVIIVIIIIVFSIVSVINFILYHVIFYC